jgi:hypothetical protein
MRRLPTNTSPVRRRVRGQKRPRATCRSKTGSRVRQHARKKRRAPRPWPRARWVSPCHGLSGGREGARGGHLACHRRVTLAAVATSRRPRGWLCARRQSVGLFFSPREMKENVGEIKKRMCGIDVYNTTRGGGALQQFMPRTQSRQPARLGTACSERRGWRQRGARGAGMHRCSHSYRTSHTVGDIKSSHA